MKEEKIKEIKERLKKKTPQGGGGRGVILPLPHF